MDVGGTADGTARSQGQDAVGDFRIPAIGAGSGKRQCSVIKLCQTATGVGRQNRCVDPCPAPTTTKQCHSQCVPVVGLIWATANAPLPVPPAIVTMGVSK